jgi:hypothetical protein
MANFNLDDYIPVNERMSLFYKEHPQGAIQTEIISNIADEIIIKAYIYRDQDDKRPCTGHAMEKAGSTYINKTSHIENCETSAVGRALAMMGYEIKKSVASREEVANARLNQEPEPRQIVTPIKKADVVNWVAFWDSTKKLGYTMEEVQTIANCKDFSKWSKDKAMGLYNDLKVLKMPPATIGGTN